MKSDSASSSPEDSPSPDSAGDSQQQTPNRQTASRHGSPSGAVLPPSNTQTRGWRQTFSSLNNRGYLFLWLGMMAMMAGMQMQMLARGYLVYDLT
ncbi:MAG: hypothetical protein OXC95_09810, partial [Dehalococcoidia bacterium]|nr:hypothetical protein [Dehalococcoidia bacterium]